MWRVPAGLSTPQNLQQCRSNDAQFFVDTALSATPLWTRLPGTYERSSQLFSPLTGGSAAGLLTTTLKTVILSV